MGNNFPKTCSPIPNAGSKLTINNNNNVKISSSVNSTVGLSAVTFKINSHHDNGHGEDNLTQSLFINTAAKVLIQDENSNQSSTTSSGHNSSSRIFSQMLQSSGKRISILHFDSFHFLIEQRLSSTSPLSNDIKPSLLDPTNNIQININSGQNRHLCTYPDCNKVIFRIYLVHFHLKFMFSCLQIKVL